MDSTDIIKHIPEIAKGAGALAAAIPFTAIVKQMLGPAADELAEMWRDQVRMYRYQRQLKCVEKAEKMAREARFTPQAVAPKILFPLLEGASFEDNDDLHTMWAALLANASADSTADLVRPSFIELLKIMTPDVAKVLNLAFDHASLKTHPSPQASSESLGIELEDSVHHDPDVIDEIMALTHVDLGTYRELYRIYWGEVQKAGTPKNSAETGSEGDERGRHRFAVAMDELHRMQMWSVEKRSKEHYYLTALAAQFVIVCRRPGNMEGAGERPDNL